MKNEEFYKGILAALGVGEDNGVPDPVWRHEEFLKQIHDALAARGVLPVRGDGDNGKYLRVNPQTGAVEWRESRCHLLIGTATAKIQWQMT